VDPRGTRNLFHREQKFEVGTQKGPLSYDLRYEFRVAGYPVPSRGTRAP